MSLVLLIVMAGLMTPTATRHFTEIRHGLGQRTRALKAGEPDPPALPIDQVVALTARRAPEVALVVGVGGFVIILGLMTLKPF